MKRYALILTLVSMFFLFGCTPASDAELVPEINQSPQEENETIEPIYYSYLDCVNETCVVLSSEMPQENHSLCSTEGASCIEVVVPVDSDSDGIDDVDDNCPNAENSGQIDLDEDGIGDVCDVCPENPENDLDGDGICGHEDNCPTVSNPSQSDLDGDGIGNNCDDIPVNCAEYTSNYGENIILLGENIAVDSCETLLLENAESSDCTTVCMFDKFDTYIWEVEGEVVNVYSCCYGHYHHLPCEDCSGENSICPDQSACDEYDPFK